MTLLELPRGYGKTNKLIEHSVSTGTPILVRTTAQRSDYEQRAAAMGYRDKFPAPVTWSDCSLGQVGEVFIDDLDTFLPEFLWANLHVKCDYATISTENVVYR